MCGISGFFRVRGRGRHHDDELRLKRQISTLWYRGPDAQGVFVGPGIGFGHARLSIIDLSPDAHQPMKSQSGRVVIAFNGEIYNFQSLRAELEELGRTFRTLSDTEVIIQGYEVWGTEVVHRLRGMFAIAIWDGDRDRLVLFRDRVGKKPLFYAEHEGTFLFASEPKAILAWPGFPREPDYQAIHEYLTYQYVPAPRSAFAGMKKLPAAHMLMVERGKAPVVQCYFELPKPRAAKARRTEELCEELIHHLSEATRLRMIADVPIGAFLSGGVDSSAVVAMMARASSTPIRTFTIGFEEQIYDERRYAAMVAKRYGTDHHEYLVRPDGMSIIEDLVYHYNEPYADSSAIPTWYVSQIARRNVTVVLNGDGGDENFLGYTRYLTCRQAEAKTRLPPQAAAAVTALAGVLPRRWVRDGRPRGLNRLFGTLNATRSRNYEQYIAYFSDAAKTELYDDGLREYLAESALDRLDPYFAEAETFASGAAWTDIHTYLPDDLLVKVDIASMAHSLEARSPFLDQELMTWAAGIPEQSRFEGNEPKSLLKKAMEPFLPREVIYRPKMGFGVPIDLWLRNEMKEYAYDLLLSDQARSRGLFRLEHVRTLMDRHVAGENWAIRIWALLMLELWFRMWIDPAMAFAHPSAQRIINAAPADLKEAI